MSHRGRHIQCINEVMLVGSGVLERQEWETACIVRSFGSAWKAFISHVGNNEVDYNRWRIAIDEM